MESATGMGEDVDAPQGQVMTAPIKSVLFVDYDSLYLSLRARDPGMARRFALRPGVWLEAIEAGLLLEPRGEEAARRRILMRRCYADPKLLGKARSAFTAQGFQIVDCLPLPGRERNSAEIHMVLDTIDALAHQTGFDEFILLSADSDLTPVIYRLRSYNRSTVIYTTLTTAAGYRAVADGVLDEQALIALLGSTADAETPETADEAVEESAPGRSGGSERDGLAGLARRVHQATNVPLFAPRVYQELFRALTREVAENGYHFQATAENVAARLSAAGRNASRRQIAFVVKGLALKGHVFSSNDNPEKLAEAFKEQVLYLARNAGIEIDEGMESLIGAWIVGRDRSAPAATLSSPAPVEAPPVSSATERPAPRPAPPAAQPVVPARPHPAPTPADAPQPTPERPAAATIAPQAAPARLSSQPPAQPAAPQAIPREARPISLQPISATMPPVARPSQVQAIPEPEAAKPEPRVEAPVERASRPAVEPPEPVLSPPPRTAPPQAEIRMDARAEQPATAPRRSKVDAESLLAEISAPQAVLRNVAPPRPRTRPPEPAAEATPAPLPASPVRPPAPRQAVGAPTATRPPARRIAPPSGETTGPRDPIESSILAAIAQAVDVLVDDGEAQAAPKAAEPQAEAPPQRGPARIAGPAPEPVRESDADANEDSDDIGDEIQRILAAYSQNRKPTGR